MVDCGNCGATFSTRDSHLEHGYERQCLERELLEAYLVLIGAGVGTYTYMLHLSGRIKHLKERLPRRYWPERLKIRPFVE